MNKLCAFISSSSGFRLRKEWVAIALAGLLLGSNRAAADPARTYCHDEFSWIECFDCSTNPEHPICAPQTVFSSHGLLDCSVNSEHPICAGVDADSAAPEAKYLYYNYALGWECDLFIVDYLYSSTPCAEAVPPTATDQKTNCRYSDDCAEFNAAEPYQHSTKYHFNGDTWDIRFCSATPCSEVVPTGEPTAVAETSWGRIKSYLQLQLLEGEGR